MTSRKEPGKVRYGVVGAGWIAQEAFMPGVGQTDNSVLTALVTGDPDPAKFGVLPAEGVSSPNIGAIKPPGASQPDLSKTGKLGSPGGGKPGGKLPSGTYSQVKKHALPAAGKMAAGRAPKGATPPSELEKLGGPEQEEVAKADKAARACVKLLMTPARPMESSEGFNQLMKPIWDYVASL